MQPFDGPRPAGDRAPAARRAAACLAVAFALAATPGSPPARAQDGVVLKDFVLTRGIQDREPLDAVDTFDPSDDQAYAFARIYNEGPPTEVSVVWWHDGDVHARIDLNVGTSPGWRTWSSANLMPGRWTVELVDENGVVLDQRDFAVGTGFGPHDMAPAGYPYEDRYQDEIPQQADQDWPPSEMPPGGSWSPSQPTDSDG